MRRVYYGPKSGISTDSLSYTQVRHYPMQPVHPDILSLFSIEAQACLEPLGLHLRMQDILLVRARDDLIFRWSRWKSNPLYRVVPCIHHNLLRLISPIMEFLHDGEEASFAHTCHKYNTDSHIVIGEFDSKIAVIMTRWINLGPGLTKQDPLWNAHLIRPAFLRERLDRDHPEQFLTAQSPRLCFEETAPQSFEELRSRNLSYLKDQQYKNGLPFIAGEPNFWYISYKEPSKKKRIEFLHSLLRRSGIS